MLLVGCGNSGGGSDREPVVVPPPETVNLIVQSPFGHSVWHLQYRTNLGPWNPEDPAQGFFVDRNSRATIADLKPGTYDFVFDLYAGPGSAFTPRAMQAVEVEPDENGDYLLVVSTQ